MKMRYMLMATVAMAAMFAQAEFVKPPVEAVKALKIARGKPVRTGLVFVDGKYLAPPYTVERYGTCIRILSEGVAYQVTNPLIDWNDFLRTQAGAKVNTTTTEAPAAAAAEEAPAEDPLADMESSSGEDDPLADLFDDDPKPKKSAKKAAKKPVRKAAPRAVTTTTVEFSGTFDATVPAAKTLLAKIDSRRAAIQLKLMNGGFYVFGSNYSPAMGPKNIAKLMLTVLPDQLRSAPDESTFIANCRARQLSFLSGAALSDIYANKKDYWKLVQRQKADAENAMFGE